VNSVEGVACPKPAKGLLSEGLLSLANGLGLAEVPNAKGEDTCAAFGWSPKLGPGPTPNENAPGFPFAVDCCNSRVGLSSIRTS
jgi:hypothetical protein